HVTPNPPRDPRLTNQRPLPLQMADGGGQPQIAQPGRLTEAIKYFLQGMGYMAAAAMTRLSRSRTGSVAEPERGRSRTLSSGGGAATPPAPPPDSP
ncbi:protein NDRG2-like, partial [Onychostruthus taczanowskii]|uniref:protein NDRG2-like n=1 Tax=Onychostruthus taczanowskii TaxID=356909 RepID=UPI001B802727